MFISCSVHLTGVGKPLRLKNRSRPGRAMDIGASQVVRFFKRRFRLAPENIQYDEIKRSLRLNM
jgi:hypothetical protein